MEEETGDKGDRGDRGDGGMEDGKMEKGATEHGEMEERREAKEVGTSIPIKKGTGPPVPTYNLIT